MTNDERIQARIARDKQRKLNRDMERAKQYGDFDSVVTLQHLQKSLNKRVRGTSWKGSVQAYVSHAIVKNYRAKQCISTGRLPDSFKVRSMTLTERGKLTGLASRCEKVLKFRLRFRIYIRSFATTSVCPFLPTETLPAGQSKAFSFSMQH